MPVNVVINELMKTSKYYINIQFMKYILQFALTFATNY